MYVSATVLTPRSIKTSDKTAPWRASDGAVRKNKPLSSIDDNAGEVADGEIITMPFGIATFVNVAVVTPEQSPPTMPATPSDVIKRSAAAPAAAASTHVVSARTAVAVEPPMNLPDADTSAIAASAPGPICATKLSIGPVKPKNTPIFTSSADAAVAIAADATVANSRFFIFVLPNESGLSTAATLCPAEILGGTFP